jgi:ABC-type tungstate transport system substrate-binding protein
MTSSGPITRDHIENRFRAIQAEVEGVETEARSYTAIAVVAVTVTVVVLAFALGSRRGRKRRTLVEIRRA